MTKFSKYTLPIISILIVLLISEGLYQFKNNANVQIQYHLSLSGMFAKKNSVESSINQFERAYEIRLAKLYNQNSKQPENQTAFPRLPDNQMLISEYKLILENLEVSKLVNSYDEWGKVLYNLGLSAYKNGETDLVISFWQKAIAIAPEWSYFHIELANYYLTNGEKDNATAQLGSCLKYQHPKSFCQWYIDNHLLKEDPDKVGFLEEKINQDI